MGKLCGLDRRGKGDEDGGGGLGIWREGWRWTERWDEEGEEERGGRVERGGDRDV